MADEKQRAFAGGWNSALKYALDTIEYEGTRALEQAIENGEETQDFFENYAKWRKNDGRN